MIIGNWLDCLVTREQLLFKIQNRYGPIIGLEKLSNADLAKMILAMKP